MNETALATLKAKAEADDPQSMFVYSEYIRPTDPVEANKYLFLAALRGNTSAIEKMGDMSLDDEDSTAADHYFRMGAKLGSVDCQVKLDVLNLSDNETRYLRELEELAESGVMSACSALAAYHKANGNRKEYNFWKSLIKK